MYALQQSDWWLSVEQSNSPLGLVQEYLPCRQVKHSRRSLYTKYSSYWSFIRWM